MTDKKKWRNECWGRKRICEMSSYYTNGTMVLGKTYLIRRKRRKTVQNIQK